MAVQCQGCGNFIQDEIDQCPVCGGTIPVESDTIKRQRMPPQGLFQESWDNLRHNRAELFTLSPTEVTLFKVAIGVMLAIFISILFVNP